MLFAFLQGMILAIGLILPLGLQNVFIFNQGATQPNYRRVLPVLIVASICDSLLIAFAIGGVSLLVFGIPWVKTTVFLIGVVFLIYMGFVTWRAKPATLDPQQSASSAVDNPMTTKQQILFTASVSLLNPHAIVDSVGVIGTASLSFGGGEKLMFAAACIFISWFWFFSLAFVGTLTKRLPNARTILITLNKISAFIMWGTASYFLYQLIFS
jgi:L-lysine exporter family protein LysE/ArgO